MKTVLAAIDNSLAGKPLLAGARALATLLGARVEAVHVAADGDQTSQSVCDAAGVLMRTVSGPVVERLVDAGAADDVVALAIGARGTPAGRRPLGGTAAAVATALLKPVLVVPPDAEARTAFRRVLVPLEASYSSGLVPRSIIEVARDAEVAVLALHIHDETSVPAFTDQPQHEQVAWTQEFLARYCPWGLGAIRLETRVGRAEELVPSVAAASGCDLIALGWSRELAPGRAAVVRGTLGRSRLPVLLVPVRLATGGVAAPPRQIRASNP